MTSITVMKDSAGNYRGFTCEGHAGYADAGIDIICAAISALTFTTVNALEELAGEKLIVEAEEETGRLECIFPEGIHEKGILLMDTMLLGLRDVRRSYGKKFIELKFEEV